MADLKTTNIYGDAYINNKVGIATNAPATRLQIGQLSPTAATEGIQFGDDTNTRIYRGASGQINFNGTINVLGNTYLGDANGDTVFVNDTIRIGATDSGDASLFFGEGSVAGSDYGARWYWDSGYTFYWYTRNAGTDTALFDYVTNDTNYINWRRHFHMQNKEINYNAQIHFNAGTRFVGSNTSYLLFRSDSTGAGGIQIQDGSATTKGYTGYWDTNGGGILNNSGEWAVRYNFGSANSGGTLYGAWTVNGNISATNLSGTNTGDQTIGNGTITIAAGTGIGVGTSNTFTMNQSGATTVTVTNSGVTSNVAGTGISVSGATGAVTITNSGVTSAVAGTGISVSGATGAVTISVANGVYTNGNNTFTGTNVQNSPNNTFVNTVTNANQSLTFYQATSGADAYMTFHIGSDFAGYFGLGGAENDLVWGGWSVGNYRYRILHSGNASYAWNMNQNVRTTDSPTFSGLSLTSVSTTGATITNLTGAYQNTTVYDSAKTQSATPSRGIRAPASSIQFTDSYAIAPFYTYRSTGDWPVPYGIGWGTGGESSGIFQRYASNGSSFGDMIFYTGNDGYGAFSFRRHTWEGTTHFAAGSGELSTELFRIDWAGNISMLGTLNGSANSATLYANNASYGSWRIGGTRNGWYGIEFESGTNLMANSNEVGFHRNGYGWQFWWSAGTGYVHKGNPGGGTQATILDSVNYTTQVNGVLLRAAGVPGAYADWNTFGNATQTTNGITQEFFNLNGGTGNSNFPTVRGYSYGALINFGTAADARAQVYISHAGNDLIFRGGWGTASWQTWNRCLTDQNQPYAYAMNQYVRTSDVPTFSGVYTTQIGINDGGMDCYINITDSNPTFNNETYGGEFYFYGDKDRPSSLLYVGGIDASRTIIASAISSRDYTRQLFPNGGYYHAGGSQTGAIKIKMYTGSESAYPMLSFTCHIYNYSTGTSRTFKIGGHYSDTQWYNVFAYCLTDNVANLNVRFGYEGTNLCVWIGETNSGWSYPTVFITDFQNGYSAINGNWMNGWTISLATAFDTVTNGPYSPGCFWNQNNDGAGSGLDADLVDGYGLATAGTANTIVLRDSSGHITGQYILGSYFNASAGNSENPTIGQIWTQNTTDNYLRKSTPAHFRSQVTDGSYPSLTGANASGTWSISISGNAATATSATNATTATNSGCITSDTGNVGENRLQYWQTSGNTTLNPDTEWYNAIRMGHGNPVTYYGNTLAVKMTGTNLGDIYTRTLTNGTQGSWNRFWNNNNDGAGSGLDADLLDGYNSATTATANTIALRDSGGDLSTRYFFGSYMNSSDDVSTGNITYIMAKFGDNYYRSATAAKVAAFITGQTMNINGSSTSCSGNAATATLATKASTLSQGGGNGTGMTFNWSGQSGQPTWLWGSNDGTNIYVWNPSNFNVNSATTATTANALNTSNSYTITGLTSNGTISIFPSYVSPYSSFLRMGYDNSGNYEYTIKRDGTTGFLEFYNTQANYTGYYFRINGSGGGLGIAVSPASRLHVNGDGTNPAVRVDNTGVVLAASVGSNGRTFYGWLPISVDGTTRWIRIFS